MKKWLRVIFKIVPLLLWHWLPLRRYAKHPERYTLEERMKRYQHLIDKIFKAFHIEVVYRYDKQAKELLYGKEKYLMVSNHLSDLDPLVLVGHNPQPLSVVAKKETEHYPLIGMVVKGLEGFFLDRENLRTSIKIIKDLSDKLEENYVSYLIFPEGTRNKNPDEPLLPFHPGSFKAAVKSGHPILPVAIYGTFRVFSKKHSYRHYLVQVDYLKPLTQEDFEDGNTPEVAKKVQKMIQDEVNKEREIDKKYFEDNLHKRKKNVPLPDYLN